MKRFTRSAAKLVVLENNDPISAEAQEIQDRIRERAYQLSQERGHSGREVDDWLTAESQIISVPPAELIEKDRAFQVTFALGNIDTENMRVMTSPNQMSVRCDFRHEHQTDGGTVHLCDFKSVTIFRSVQFPEPIDVNSVAMEYQDGLLRLTAAKEGAEPVPPKRTSTRKAPAKKKHAS